MARTKLPKAPTYDIRKTGSLTYQQLQELNALQYKNAVDSIVGKYGTGPITVPAARKGSPLDYLWSGPVASPILTQSGGKDWVGNSYWDRDEYTLQDVLQMYENPNELRALDQPGAILLLNSVIKMQELAASTFLNSTLGLIGGFGKGLYNLATGENFLRGFWDNAVTQSLQDMNEYFELILPNYYTQKETEEPWYKNILTANFFGDKLLKNMGFTIGAIGAAYVTGGLGLGAKLGQYMSKLGYADKAIRATTNIANGVVNTALSAAGEASIEAYQAVHDGIKNNEQSIKNFILENQLKFAAEMLEQIDAGIAPELAQATYNNKMKEVYQNADLMEKEYLNHTTQLGNSVFGTNMAILSLTNSLEFGNIMKGGWGTNKLFSKLDDRISRTVGGKTVAATEAGDEAFARGIIRGESKYASNLEEPSKAMMVGTGIKNMFTEGFEEGALRLVSDASLIRAAAQTQEESMRKGLIDHALNPEVTSAMVNYSDAITKAWSDAFDGAEKSGWEEVALGAITGLLGVPMVKKKANGKLGLTLMGGFSQEYRDAKQEYQQILDRISEMNNHIDSNKMRASLLRGTANLSMLRASRMALFNDDHALFKNLQALRSANTALFLNQQHDLGLGYSAAVDELSNNLTDEDIELYKETRAREVGEDKDQMFKGKTNDEIKAMLQHDMLDYKRLVERALELSDKVDKNKKALKLTDFAHDEFFSSYVLRDNITERIGRIEEENQKLNEDDPLDKQQLETNNRDLKRLREDKRILDERIEFALNNPEQFQKVVDKKVMNLQKAYMVKLNEEKVKQLLNVTSMSEVAGIMDSIDIDSRDTVLDKAYKDSNESVKRIIDDYKKFYDAKDTIFFKIRLAFNNRLDTARNKAEKDAGSATLRALEAITRIQQDEQMTLWYTDLASEATPITLEDLQQQVDALNNPELSQKFQQFANEYAIADLENSMNDVNDSFSSASRDIRNQYKELEKLMYAVYEDLIFKDQTGLTSLTVANEIRNKLDTLEASQSLDPAVIEDVKQVLSELDSVDKINAIADKTRKERNAELEQLVKKAQQNKKDSKKEGDKEEPKKKPRKESNKQEPDKDDEGTLHYPILQAFEKYGITPSENINKLRNFGVKIHINGTDKVELINDNIENKELERYNLREFKHPNVVLWFISDLLKGFVISDNLVKQYLNALNKYVTDEIIAWAEENLTPVSDEELNEEKTKDSTEKKDKKKDKKEEPSHPAEDKSKIEPTDYPANNFTEFYPGTWVTRKNKDNEEIKGENGKPIWENPWRYALEKMTKSAPSLEMFADGIHPQFFIDNLLHKIITKNPDIKLRYIVRTVDRYDEESGKTVPSTNIYVGFAKRDIEEADPDLLSLYDESNLSVKNTNDGEYVIFGTMGYFTDARKTVVSKESKVVSSWKAINRFESLKKRLMKDREKFAEEDNEFYVDTELYNFVKPMTSAGDMIMSTDSEKKNEIVTIDKDFLASEYRNPHHLNASNMQFVVVMGNNEDGLRAEYILRGLDNENEPIFYEPTLLRHAGAMMLYIPTANGNMMPIYLTRTVFSDISDREGFKESQWYLNLLNYAKVLLNPNITDSKTKLEAIGKIRDMLMFNDSYDKKNNIRIDLKYNSRTDTLERTVNSFVTREGKTTPDTEIIESIEEFEQFLEEANPMIAILKNQIEGLNGTEYLELLMEIGALRTDVKILGTKKAMFYIYGMKENLSVDRKESSKPLANKHPDNTDRVVWLSLPGANDKKVSRKFIVKEDGIYDAEDLLVTDEEILRQIDYTTRIENGNGISFKYKSKSSKTGKPVQYYIFSATEVYQKTTRNYARLDKNRALLIYSEYLKSSNKEAKKKEVEKKMERKPIEVDLKGEFDEESGWFSPDEPIIISRDDLVEPIDIDGELQVVEISPEGDVVNLFVIDKDVDDGPAFLNVKLKRKILEFKEDKKVDKEEEKKLEKKTENKKVEHVEKNATEEEKSEPKKKPEEENKKPVKKRAKKFASRSKKDLDNPENDGTFVAEIELALKNSILRAYRKNNKDNKEIILRKIAEKQGEELKDIQALTLPQQVDLMHQLINDYSRESGETIIFETLSDTDIYNLFACKI